MPRHTGLVILVGRILLSGLLFGQADAATPAPSNSGNSHPAETSAPAAKPTASTAPTTRAEAWQILDDAAKGDSAGNRALAIRVLGLIPGNVHARQLAESGLIDDKSEVRIAAVSALGEMGAKTSISKLEAELQDQDPTVVLATAHALNQLGDAQAYDVYYEVLTGNRKASKGLIASQTSILTNPKKLAELGFEEGLGFIPFAGVGWAAIKAVTKDDASRVRAAAAKVLAQDPDPGTTDGLCSAAMDDSWVVRVSALESLSKRGDLKALNTVMLEIYDEKEVVRFTAAAAYLHLLDLKETAARKRRRPASNK
jgi:HEAT repeat protein